MKGQLSFIPGYKYEPPDQKEAEAKNKKYTRPIEKFGKGPAGMKCGDCKYLIATQYSRTYFKCARWIVSGSAATDIRKSGQACGQFERR